MSEQYVAITRITFEDGSREAQEIARGSKDECRRVLDATPALAYSGDKKITDCRAGFMPAADWDSNPVIWRW